MVDLKSDSNRLLLDGTDWTLESGTQSGEITVDYVGENVVPVEVETVLKSLQNRLEGKLDNRKIGSRGGENFEVDGAALLLVVAENERQDADQQLLKLIEVRGELGEKSLLVEDEVDVSEFQVGAEKFAHLGLQPLAAEDVFLESDELELCFAEVLLHLLEVEFLLSDSAVQ